MVRSSGIPKSSMCDLVSLKFVTRFGSENAPLSVLSLRTLAIALYATVHGYMQKRPAASSASLP